MERDTIVWGYLGSKRGIGKTTLQILMSGYLAYSQNKKLLLIDADPQHILFFCLMRT